MALSAEDVARRIDEAYYTLSRLPKVTVDSYKSNWPAVVRDFNEAYGYGEAMVRPGPPPSAKITEMDETLRWLLWLDVYHARLVWLRAGGARWKTISWRLGHGKTKLQEDWKLAIYAIHFALKTNQPIKAREPVFARPAMPVFSPKAATGAS